MNEVLWTLVRAGLPADVVVAGDLADAWAAGRRAVLVNDVAVLEPKTAAGLARFAKAGGTVVLAGAGRVRGRFESPEQASPLSRFLPGAADFVSRSFGPDDMKLDGYEREGGRVKVRKHGRASVVFKGPAGAYRIAVRYMAESDGQGRFELEANGKTIGRWASKADDDAWHTFTSAPVTLAPGAVLTVVGHSGGGEYGRVSAVKVSPASADGAVATCRLGRGRVLQLGGPITEAAPQELEAVVKALRPLCPVRGATRPWPETLLLTATRAAPGGPVCVHLVNYDFRYGDKHKLESIQPSGPVELAAPGARSARLLSPDGGQRDLPVEGGVVRIPPVRVYSVVVVQ